MKKIFLILITLVPFLTKAQVTLIPDATFEQLLINLNIDSDGIVNGQILTSDAQNVTQLNLGYGGGGFWIQDMTGIEDFTNLESIESYFHSLNTINLTTLTKLKTLILPSNWLATIDLSATKDLEYLEIGNHLLEFLQYNTMSKLDLSNNTKLKRVIAYNLYTLEYINMRNNMADTVDIKLGNENSDPYNVCIEVDDYIAATNGTTPYDTWIINNTSPGNHFFSDNCALSTENFIQNNFKIYPNPAMDYVSVEYDEKIGVKLRGVQILDSSGKWIRSVKENFHQIDVSDLSSGVYLFVIQTDKGNKTEKVVVK